MSGVNDDAANFLASLGGGWRRRIGREEGEGEEEEGVKGGRGGLPRKLMRLRTLHLMLLLPTPLQLLLRKLGRCSSLHFQSRHR